MLNSSESALCSINGRIYLGTEVRELIFKQKTLIMRLIAYGHDPKDTEYGFESEVLRDYLYSSCPPLTRIQIKAWYEPPGVTENDSHAKYQLLYLPCQQGCRLLTRSV